MPEPRYTVEQLRELLAMARELGFADDVLHWRHALAERGFIE